MHIFCFLYRIIRIKNTGYFFLIFLQKYKQWIAKQIRILHENTSCPLCWIIALFVISESHKIKHNRISVNINPILAARFDSYDILNRF